MKTVYTMIIALLFTGSIFAQDGVGINSDGTDAHGSAMLDVKSANKGFLPPRMTTAELNAIASPAEGLMAFNTTINSLVFYNGTGWIRSDGQFYIGAYYGGGIIFYIDGTGKHGFISATSDQSSGTTWGCFGTSIPGTSTAIGAGQANTTLIVNGCATAGIAARICNDLVLNGFSDWFLPSKDELNLLYLQQNVVGGFSGGELWNSYEQPVGGAAAAGVQNFAIGLQYNYNKSLNAAVRAVRAF